MAERPFCVEAWSLLALSTYCPDAVETSGLSTKVAFREENGDRQSPQRERCTEGRF
jgi:hypothetical protein